MNKSQPFKRLHNFYAAIQQVLATARVQGAEALEIQRSMLGMYRAPMGKGRGRQAHSTAQGINIWRMFGVAASLAAKRNNVRVRFVSCSSIHADTYKKGRVSIEACPARSKPRRRNCKDYGKTNK